MSTPQPINQTQSASATPQNVLIMSRNSTFSNSAIAEAMCAAINQGRSILFVTSNPNWANCKWAHLHSKETISDQEPCSTKFINLAPNITCYVTPMALRRELTQPVELLREMPFLRTLGLFVIDMIDDYFQDSLALDFADVEMAISRLCLAPFDGINRQVVFATRDRCDDVACWLDAKPLTDLACEDNSFYSRLDEYNLGAMLTDFIASMGMATIEECQEVLDHTMLPITTNPPSLSDTLQQLCDTGCLMLLDTKNAAKFYQITPAAQLLLKNNAVHELMMAGISIATMQHFQMYQTNLSRFDIILLAVTSPMTINRPELSSTMTASDLANELKGFRSTLLQQSPYDLANCLGLSTDQLVPNLRLALMIGLNAKGTGMSSIADRFDVPFNDLEGIRDAVKDQLRVLLGLNTDCPATHTSYTDRIQVLNRLLAGDGKWHIGLASLPAITTADLSLLNSVGIHTPTDLRIAHAEKFQDRFPHGVFRMLQQQAWSFLPDEFAERAYLQLLTVSLPVVTDTTPTIQAILQS